MELKKRLRRIGCGALLVLWFIFLLSPCLMIYLAVRGEIVLQHSDVPDDEFRLWSISEASRRGLGISNSQRITTQDGLICTITDVNFLMWEGKGVPATYCSCYTHSDNQYVSALEGDDACHKAGR